MKRAALLFLLLLAGCGRSGSPDLQPLEIGGEIGLQDSSGEVFRLASHPEEVKILFFGYASCPDACPLALSRVASVARALGDDEEQLLTVFVSVDPARDSPQQLDEFIHFFGIRGIGVTGPKEAVDEVVARYGAHYEMIESRSSYLVNHSTYLYLLDKQNRVRRIIGSDDTTEQIASWVETLLREG